MNIISMFSRSARVDAFLIVTTVLMTAGSPMARGVGDNKEKRLAEGATLSLDPKNFLSFQYLPQGGVRVHFTRAGRAGIVDVACGATNHRDPTAIERIDYVNKDKIWIYSNNHYMGEEAVLVNLTRGLVERHFCGQEVAWSPDKTHVAYRGCGKRRWGEAAAFVDALMLYPRVTLLNKDGLGNVTDNANDFWTIAKTDPLGRNKVDRFIILSPRWLDRSTVEFVIGERDRASADKDHLFTAFARHVFSGVDAPRDGKYRLTERVETLNAERLGENIESADDDLPSTITTRLADFVTSSTTRTHEVPTVDYRPRAESPRQADSATTRTAVVMEPVNPLTKASWINLFSVSPCLRGEIRFD